MDLNFSGMILAAGFGKRLMPLTKNLPKSLIEINNTTLLANCINFLKKSGCKEIIINSHYQYKKIHKFINNLNDSNIILIYEKEILDTGGAIKNAMPYFKNKNIIVANSDIFWQNQNIKDCKILIENFFLKKESCLLLSEQNSVYGLKKDDGDFILDHNSRVTRYQKGNNIYYYSGLQMINTDIFSYFKTRKFSFNCVWDYLIKKEQLFGNIMKSDLYHVGDIQGLNIARKLDS